jgi:Zn-dependent peptidase ImmA (M78 family)
MVSSVALPTLPDVVPEEIIKKHQTEAPVDVVAIARDFGLFVWEMKNLPENISGKIFRDAENGGPSGFSIGVNSSEPFTRKRFTVAHEIAHFILHRDQLERKDLEDDTMYRSGLSTKEETEANKLAADILMPLPLIRSLIRSGFTNVQQLADKLQVSQPAMSIRLQIPVP